MISFCTLFDSFYLDKGIALYRSLERHSNDFTLYIFCFDDKSYEILSDLGFSRAIVIHHSAFETAELLKRKEERSKAEYCWTCTPVVIEYVLDNYPVENCTYIDADVFFFSDPQTLFDEIEDSKANVVIVEHRFKNNTYGKKLEKRNGKYCVEFNYFDQSKNGREALKWWKDQCYEWCYDQPEPNRMGDQKYLEQFPDRFSGVHILQHRGGGVAPWNLEKYRLKKARGEQIVLKDEEEFPLVFYHFQNIRYLPGRRANIKSQTIQKNIKYAIYIPYLSMIEEVRNELYLNYGVGFGERGVIRSSNPIWGFLQKHLANYKLQTLSDIVHLDKLQNYEVNVERE